MDISEILKHVDHTLLSPTATWDEIRDICDDGIKYGAASVCIPPSYVKRAADYADGRISICTVIGFPNGYNTKEIKISEARQALADGADEIDMVINQGDVKMGAYDKIEEEIRALKEVADGKILKVIIETCNLTDEEKIKMCEVVTVAGADYIKTSTGFGRGGATFDDVALFAAHIGAHVKIKAAGGISGLDDAEKFLALGADRLGTSRIIKTVKQTEAQNG